MPTKEIGRNCRLDVSGKPIPTEFHFEVVVYETHVDTLIYEFPQFLRRDAAVPTAETSCV
jgi:hypothetical protein